LGKELLKNSPESTQLVIYYADGLVKLGKKREAVDVLLQFAEKKLKEDYFEMAIPILKKVLKIDQFNLKAIKLLATAYRKKELYYDAFNVLTNAFENFRKSGKDISQVKGIIEEFLKEAFHPLFYEKYGDLLREFGLEEEAAVNYVLAGNMYINLKKYKSALRVFLKTKDIKPTDVVYKQIVEVISRITDESPEISNLLLSIIKKFGTDFDFIEFTVSQFKETNKLLFLKKTVESLASPLIKYVYLALIDQELGEEENVREYLNKIRLIDKNLYDKTAAYVSRISGGKIELSTVKTSEEEEIPEPGEVLSVLDKVIEVEETVPSYLISEKTPETPEDIKKEIKTLKEHKDGKRLVSMAEAMIGLGKYKEAEDFARKAIDTNEGSRAVLLAAEAMRLQGREKDATAFLLENLKGDFPEEEKARFEVKLGEIYRQMGDRDRALYWFESAQKILKDPDIQKEIDELRAQTV
jgi:tetratricopeptide (TPR) repeat protein